jgi:DNA-binding winged helix-turn-helix (wHTH) protein
MRYVFDDCILDTQQYALRRRGVRLPLRRKVFQVLVSLIEQRHRVVSRDELLAQVWPNQYVGDETLTSCVKAVRRAVGDSGRAQRVIRTVHGRGLQFVANITVIDSLPTPSAPPAPASGMAPMSSAPELLVGREAELATLHRWYTTAQQGTRQVGFITGEAGIGKTALVETFVARVASEGAAWIGRGQCIDQYGTGEAYLPMLEALGRLCRGPDGAFFLAWLRQSAPSWLAPTEQIALEAASVVGADFSAAAVAAGIGASVEDIDTQCARLARQGRFVHADSPTTWPDGTVAGHYRFRHALYQEVVYERIPAGWHTRLHLQIGAWEAQAYGTCGEERAAELAMHFERGRITAGPSTICSTPVCMPSSGAPIRRQCIYSGRAWSCSQPGRKHPSAPDRNWPYR